MTVLTQADLLKPTLSRNARLYDAALILAGSAVVAMAAQVAVRLPFSPVPVTGQTLAVLLVGALLGSKRGSLVVLAYLLEGLLGLPVFAGGLSGPAILAGPTAGYLIGFVPAAFCVGRLAELGWDRRIITTALAMALGNAVIYAAGLVWLAAFVGRDHVLALGLYPFIPGDLAKLILAALFLPAGWKWLGWVKRM